RVVGTADTRPMVAAIGTLVLAGAQDWGLDQVVVGVVAIVAAIVMPIVLYLWARRRKRLVFRARRVLVASVNAQFSRQVQILFDGQPVSSACLVEVSLENTGNEEVHSRDFERPLRFSFEKGSRILTSKVSAVRPAALRPDLRRSETGTTDAELQPLVLNARDQIDFQFLVDGDGDVKVDARIAGVTTVDRDYGTGDPGQMSLSETLASFLIFLGPFLGVMALVQYVILPGQERGALKLSALLVLGIALPQITKAYIARYRRRRARENTRVVE
ncbi:MAG: hypothetical protein ACREND_08380, partial [Gemmatimonadaceae bacterium]